MRFPFVTQVMWATRAPQSHRGKVLVVIAIDGTRSHNRSFLHFSVGDVQSSLPYGSWVGAGSGECARVGVNSSETTIWTIVC